MPAQLPPEVLLQVASQCLSVFSDQELWFQLAHVSRLFRSVVERFVTTDSPIKKAMCTRLELESLEEHECELLCYDKSCPDPQNIFCDYKFCSIDSENPNPNWAIFKCMSDSSIMNSDSQAKRLIEQPPVNHGMRITFSTNIITPLNSYEDEWQTSLVDVGSPVHASLDDTSREHSKLVIAFDWRKIWTLKCAPQRKLERLQYQLQHETLSKVQQAEKDAAEEAHKHRRWAIATQQSKFQKRKRST